MSIAELKAEVDRLSADERMQLRAYLAHKINDRTPGRWLTIEELEARVSR